MNVNTSSFDCSTYDANAELPVLRSLLATRLMPSPCWKLGMQGWQEVRGIDELGWVHVCEQWGMR